MANNTFEAAYMKLKNGMTLFFKDGGARELIDKLKALVDTKYGPDNPPPGAQNIWYAVCSSSYSDAAKTATSATGDFVLATGNMVRVKFTNTNNQLQPTLSVDGSTAARIKNLPSESNINTQWWRAGEVIDLVYDGTDFIMSDGGQASTGYYGKTILSNSTSSASQTTAATSKAVKDVNDALASLPYALSNSVGGAAELSVAIPYGEVDGTSTSTAFTVTVPGIHELKDGVCCYVRNDTVSSATNCTIDVNGLGAKPMYITSADATRVSTQFTAATTYLLIYNENRVTGGCWDFYQGAVSSNTIGYQLRTNSTTMPLANACYRYRLLFTSADGAKFVPATTSTSTNATAARTTNTTPIDPFGAIVYYGSTTIVNSGVSPSATVLWQQYVCTLGYSFNNTGSALTLTVNKPIYLRCTPQTDGSAVMDYFTQSLPSSEDGYIYIFLGVAASATTMELNAFHPIYYYKDSSIRLWTHQAPTPVPSPSDATPQDLGTADPGVSDDYSRADHVHNLPTFPPGALYFTNQAVAATTGDICTISDAAITADYVLVSCVFANPDSISPKKVAWATSSGSLVLNGTCSAATTVSVVLVPKDN